MPKKGITVWIFSSLTFIALIHLTEATSTLIFNNETRLIQLYPFIGEKLQTVTPITYFIASATATLILWGITCVVAFTNPVESFLNKILLDAKKQSTVETQMLEDKSEILDIMNETMEANNELLAQVRDIIYNIRAEVKEIEPLKEKMEKVKSEVGFLRREIKRLEEKVYFPKVCLSCGKPVLPEFKICPYCGEDIKFPQETLLSVKEYK